MHWCGYLYVCTVYVSPSVGRTTPSPGGLRKRHPLVPAHLQIWGVSLRHAPNRRTATNTICEQRRPDHLQRVLYNFFAHLAATSPKGPTRESFSFSRSSPSFHPILSILFSELRHPYHPIEELYLNPAFQKKKSLVPAWLRHTSWESSPSSASGYIKASLQTTPT